MYGQTISDIYGDFLFVLESVLYNRSDGRNYDRRDYAPGIATGAEPFSISLENDEFVYVLKTDEVNDRHVVISKRPILFSFLSLTLSLKNRCRAYVSHRCNLS